MSVNDSRGTSRTFVQIAGSGFDKTYVATNPDALTQITLRDKQIRPTKIGGVAQVLRQVTIQVTDSLGNVTTRTVNVTIKAENTVVVGDRYYLDAVALCLRGITPEASVTMVGTVSETNVKNIQVGAMPTP